MLSPLLSVKIWLLFVLDWGVINGEQLQHDVSNWPDVHLRRVFFLVGLKCWRVALHFMLRLHQLSCVMHVAVQRLKVLALKTINFDFNFLFDNVELWDKDAAFIQGPMRNAKDLSILETFQQLLSNLDNDFLAQILLLLANKREQPWIFKIVGHNWNGVLVRTGFVVLDNVWVFELHQTKNLRDVVFFRREFCRRNQYVLRFVLKNWQQKLLWILWVK